MWRKLKSAVLTWLDNAKLAGKGILLVSHEKRFIVAFLIAFLFFGTLMTMLSSGLSEFQLIDSLPSAFQIIGRAILRVFGYQRFFLDWLATFLLAVLQGILIGLIAWLWKKRQDNSADVERAGLIAGLIALGAGCPTCGTTLVAPLLGALFSTGGIAMVGTVSIVVTVIAIIVAVLSLVRLGKEAYIIIINEKYSKKENGRARKNL
jgi:hypothetical protein